MPTDALAISIHSRGGGGPFICKPLVARNNATQSEVGKLCWCATLWHPAVSGKVLPLPARFMWLRISRVSQRRPGFQVLASDRDHTTNEVWLVNLDRNDVCEKVSTQVQVELMVDKKDAGLFNIFKSFFSAMRSSQKGKKPDENIASIGKGCLDKYVSVAHYSMFKNIRPGMKPNWSLAWIYTRTQSLLSLHCISRTT